ncbi:MAG: transposase [Candidatus Accumulibacter sp.]|uniref:Transposase n=1 Tax=Candidatus Accumulibacter cognatus TaxID=2954383 RepID=A0A7D5SET4_9PROT|nr:transposase [Accumulibacter sp.]MCM8623995.1 transposase [Accumulibacter sp.]QLH51737.1 MAG: transposase [Candidatus Accumulibacter cognatus]
MIIKSCKLVDRFLQHALPAGFKRIRHYGLLSLAHQKETLASARTVLVVPPPEHAVIESVAASMPPGCIEHARCPHGGIGQWTGPSCHHVTIQTSEPP